MRAYLNRRAPHRYDSFGNVPFCAAPFGNEYPWVPPQEPRRWAIMFVTRPTIPMR
jgi:hypothetical protein